MSEKMKAELSGRAFELECMLIGSVNNGGDIDAVKGMINTENFVDPQNQVIWEAMLKISNANRRPTVKMTTELLTNHPLFDNSVDLLFAAKGNLDGIPQFIKRTAGSLSQAHTRLALAQTCEAILSEIGASEHEVPTDKLLLDVRDAIDTMKVQSGFEAVKTVAIDGELLEDIANPPPITKTIIKQYNQVLGGGMMAGETYTLAGANKSGKTMMAGTISAGLAEDAVPHEYWCLEMGRKQIVQRMVAARMGFSVGLFMHEYGRTSKQLADFVSEHQAWAINHDHINFIACPLLRASDAKSMLYRAKMNGMEGVIIDYFSLISPDIGFRGTQNEHQDNLAQELTKTAKDLGIWILMVAQTNATGSTYGSAALLRASTHIAVLERVEDVDSAKHGFRWLRTISARLTMAHDIGSLTEPGLKIHKNGSHIEELLPQDNDEIEAFQ